MQLGVIGLGTMGVNLARNAARNGAEVVVFNRTAKKTDAFLRTHGKEGTFTGARTLAELCGKLRSPRAILLMVTSGAAVDALITELLPFLTKGDLLIDGGNSHYRDTERRAKILEDGGMHFIGLGVSGGEKGALRGPSLMPGGAKQAYERVAHLLTAMAADDGVGGKCVTYLGPGGAGHFVKMVHNGIEYGVMQLLAEAYHLLKEDGGLSHESLASAFEGMKDVPALDSFLVETAIRAFRAKDPESDADLLDVIKDMAAQKGTGTWTVEAGLHYGVSIPTITAAVDARIVSSGKDFRVQESARTTRAVAPRTEIPDLLPNVQRALELSIINTYAQGFQLLSVASGAEQWKLPLSEVARIWRGGCIVRSGLLPLFQKMFSGDQKTSETVRARFTPDAERAWRSVVALGAGRGIPLPAMSASLSYYDGYRTARLPQNLTAAQRDIFGAHGFERLDRPGIFHVAST